MTELNKISTATVATALFKRGFRHQCIHELRAKLGAEIAIPNAATRAH